MRFFKFKKSSNHKIDEEFITENANEVNKADVKKVITEASKIRSKLESNNRFSKNLEEGKTMLNLIKDYWRKDYTKAPWYSIAAMVFTLLYILNPMDLAPDFIPFFGYIDDVTVFTLAISMVKKDLISYRVWKEKK